MDLCGRVFVLCWVLRIWVSGYGPIQGCSWVVVSAAKTGRNWLYAARFGHVGLSLFFIVLLSGKYFPVPLFPHGKQASLE